MSKLLATSLHRVFGRARTAGVVLATRLYLIIAAFFSLGPLGAEEAPGAEITADELRVMSFNIKQHNPDNPKLVDSPHRWDLRKALVSEVIRDEGSDLVAVQEAYRHQLDDLLTALPGYRLVGEGRDGGRNGEHCAILYRAERFELQDGGTFWLSDTPEKPSKSWGHFYRRICTWAHLIEKDGGQAIHVFNTHLDHQSQVAREKSVRLIARRVVARKKPSFLLVTGDFNAGENDPVIRYLKGKHEEASPHPMVDSFRVVRPQATEVGTGSRFSGYTAGNKIDYIFVAPGAQVTAAGIVRTHRDGRYPSDHYPVTATVRLGP